MNKKIIAILLAGGVGAIISTAQMYRLEKQIAEKANKSYETTLKMGSAQKELVLDLKSIPSRLEVQCTDLHMGGHPLPYIKIDDKGYTLIGLDGKLVIVEYSAKLTNDGKADN